MVGKGNYTPTEVKKYQISGIRKGRAKLIFSKLKGHVNLKANCVKP